MAAAVIVGDLPEGRRDEQRAGRGVLLVRRRVPEGELVWQFPAGVIEVGESAEDAAVREAGEETGLAVRALRVLGSRVHPLTRRVIVYVACAPATGHADLADHVGDARVASIREVEAVVWVSGDQLPRYIPPDALFAPVRAYVAAALSP